MHLFCLLTALVFCVAVAAPVHAQAPLRAADIAAYSQHWLDSMLAQRPAMPDLPLRMEVQVGKLDSRLRLAPCQNIQAWLPTGAHLWGRTRIGLRCTNGSVPWKVFVPITVHAFGMAWVLNKPVVAGHILEEQDAALVEVDWAAQPAAIVARRADWRGQTAARALPAGQALRRNMLRPMQVFRSGAHVQVLLQGPGYTITASAQALQAGIVGHSVRVRLDSGKVLVGTVGADGAVLVNGVG